MWKNSNKTLKALKVLHWPSSYPDPKRGKPYDCIFIKEHIKSLAPYCENRVLYTSPDMPTSNKMFELKTTIEDGIKTDRIYFKTIRPLWITNIYVRVVLFYYLLRLIVVERYYPDIVHVHFHQAGLLAILFCRLFRIPMVETEHWTAFVGFPEISEQRFKKASKVFRYSRFVLPVSMHLMKGIEEKTGLDLSSKNRIINNSVDSKIFYYIGGGFSDGFKRILVVARLDEQKDFPNLFNAIGILKRKGNSNIKVIIIGKGNAAQYDGVIEGNNIGMNVIFLGEKDKHFIADEMRKADILCLSSISENSPCVIGEALCTGLPVVSTNVGGIPELLDNSNGILVPPRDSEKLADALYQGLFERGFDQEVISKKAQAHFSYSAIGQQIFNAYQKVLGQIE